MTSSIRIPKNISLSVNSQNVAQVLVQDTQDQLWLSTVTNTSSGTINTKWYRLPPIVVDNSEQNYPIPEKDGDIIPNTVDIQYTGNI